MNYNKPLGLRLQWILKEMKEKSEIIANKQQTTTVYTTSTKSLLLSELKLNLTDNLDDYPTDSEFDYADYMYEDSIDGQSSSTTIISSTTLQSSSISIYDDISIDDINTVSYYDYAEQDVYSDDEIVDTNTQPLFSTTTTSSPTTTVRIPLYHQRRPIIWNINIDDDDDDHQQSKQQYNSSFSHNYSFLLLLLLLIFIVT
jgi:hypothetical protein